MHQIALELKELFKLWEDRSAAGIRLSSKDARKIIDSSLRPVLSSRSAVRRAGVAKDIVFPCEAARQPIGG
jgi:hypothetical protein